ncbi:hypothetical protein L21SP2_3059 [Salinispira pacifica]|uniref:Uncharacterized protein n=1 Tax=Salinispira pacifica TaxID=1307761 RepID=V5WKX7_9SPIO|nr:hypothetical protein L21SP2_3059 [Salinispira pacifica]
MSILVFHIFPRVLQNFSSGFGGFIFRQRVAGVNAAHAGSQAIPGTL